MLEERAMKNQHQLPDRPKLIWCKNDHKITMEEVQSKLMDPTQSSLKNQLTKVELEERSRHREESQAHSLLIPCIDAIRDVTAKSFGHIPIQPRSIPSWRQNLRCAWSIRKKIEASTYLNVLSSHKLSTAYALKLANWSHCKFPFLMLQEESKPRFVGFVQITLFEMIV